MDVMERVREVNPGASLTEEQIERARRQLGERIDAGQASTSRRRRAWPFLVLGGLVAGTAAVAAVILVVSQLTAPGPQVEAVPTTPAPVESIPPKPLPTPTPKTAAQVLEGAAMAAENFTPPSLAPGQYLRRTWTTEAVMFYESTFGTGASGFGGDRSTATSGWLVKMSGTQYIPGDLVSQRYGDVEQSEIIALYGDLNEAEARSSAYLQSYGLPEALEPYSINIPWAVDGGGGVDDLASFFAAMPRDPESMIAWIREHQSDSSEAGWDDGKVGWLLIDLLGHNVGAPELRGAMYRALSLLPGSSVGDEVDGRRTITFLSDLEANGSMHLNRITLTIEMSTGMVVELTETWNAVEGVVPITVPDRKTTYSSSVVDVLP